MLVVKHENGLYKIVASDVQYQGRTLEKALANALQGAYVSMPPDEMIFQAAAVLEGLVPRGPENTQISTT